MAEERRKADTNAIDENYASGLTEDKAAANSSQAVAATQENAANTSATGHLTRNENAFNQYMTQMARIRKEQQDAWNDTQKDLVSLHTELNKSVIDGNQVSSNEEVATTALMMNMVKQGLSESTINAVCACIQNCRK